MHRRQTSSSTTLFSRLPQWDSSPNFRGLQGRLLLFNANDYAFLVQILPHPEVQTHVKTGLPEIQNLQAGLNYLVAIHAGKQGVRKGCILGSGHTKPF